jgi:hypothetical protein
MAKFLGAPGKRPLCVALGYDQLRQSFYADDQDQQVIQSFVGPYQLSRTSSAEKPGPMAIISPIEPGGGGSVIVP